VRDMRSQLSWVHRNRSRRDRSAPLAEVVQRWVRSVDVTEGVYARELAAALGEVVDESFSRCCLIGGLHDGLLLINVADASSVGWMRRVWRSRILEIARTRFPKAKVRDVQFAFGVKGEAVGTPDEACQ
jgi:hypothetical protein